MFEALAPFRTSKKGSFLPLYLEMGDFEINSNKGFEQSIEMLRSLHLLVGSTTRQFDPEGYFSSGKKTTLGKVEHEFELRDELMRNCHYYEEVKTRRSTNFKVQKIESRKRLEDPSYQGIFLDELKIVKRMERFI